ncbi:hypothetical protein [Micromonospora chalcea]|uniref:hypothetical protein n=1 Tax=Micromonospora chalcea TaxID=1874 RepID=UPI00157D59C5|nr:hypothetical protein [Micromonospora chalcea]
MHPDIASVEEANRIIGPHLEDLGKLFTKAWKTWTDLPPDVKARRTRRTRASWLHDDLTEEARQLFENKPDVEVTDSRGFLILTFENRLVMRFKKFTSRSLRTSGIMTYQRQAYETQQFQLPGLPSVTTTVAGYLLDALERDFHRLAVVCPFDGDNLWTIDIPMPGEGGQTVPLSPVAPAPLPRVEVRSLREAQSEPDQKEA